MAVGVGNDGELDSGLRSFVYVGDPVGVGAEIIGTLRIRISKEEFEAWGGRVDVLGRSFARLARQIHP